MTERRLISVRLSGSVLNHKFPSRWIGRGGVHNWPPRSSVLNPLDYLVWGYMKAIVYAHKANTREELLQRTLNAARSMNNAAVLWHNVSGHTSQKMYPSRHIEQLA